jgi:capsular polysaccharide biosynthesis protein
MELREYWRVFRRRFWIPLLLMVIAVASTGAVTYLAAPEYVATASVVARGNGSGALSFPEIAKSNSLALRVIQQLNLKEGVDSLTARIDVTSGRSNLYRIAVTDFDAGRAVAVANSVAREAAALYQQLATDTTQTVNDALQKNHDAFRNQYIAAAKAVLDFKAQHPDAFVQNANPKDTNVGAQALELQLEASATADAYTHFREAAIQSTVDELNQSRTFSAGVVDEAAAKPETSARSLKVAYSAALAFVVGVGLIFALEFLDNSIRDPEEIEQLTGWPLIGIIPRGSDRVLRPVKEAA